MNMYFPEIMLTGCTPDEARVRLKRIEQLGFDEVLVVSPGAVLDEIERVRDFL
jgi:hypothetical protein